MKEGTLSMPKVGADIYVPSRLYMSHGIDDFCGGLATVIEVRENISGGEFVPFIRVNECPCVSHNWEMLSKRQGELKEMFGESRAHCDPDYRSEFNEW